MVAQTPDAHGRISKFLSMRGVAAPPESRLAPRLSSVYVEGAVYELNATDLSELLSEVDNLREESRRLKHAAYFAAPGRLRSA